MKIKNIFFVISLFITLGLSNAHAVTMQFNGTLDLYQNTSLLASESISGSFSFTGIDYQSDFTGNFSGTVVGLPATGSLTIPTSTSNIIASPFQMTWNNQVFSGDLLLDVNIISLDLIQIISLDSDNDGIPGLVVATGANGNTSIALSGQFSTVPVPAAIWLFISGLIGLAGFTGYNRA